MRLLRHALLLSTLLSPVAALAQDAPFSHPIVTRDAERIESLLKSQPPPAAPGAAAPKAARVEPAQLRQQGLQQIAENPRIAMLTLRQALAADPADREAWLGLARAILAIPVDGLEGSERYDLPSHASGAAWKALGLAQTDIEKADALELLSSALQRRSLWRPAIDALRSSLASADRPANREALEKLRAEHGFRVVDYKVEADAAEPRLCVNFSERLAQTAADLAKFITVDGREPQSLSGDGQQLCVDGLAHGRRYEIQVRAGVPAGNGESLQKAASIAAYVRDRKPAVRFTGRAYVLPSRGQQGVPVVSINTDKVAVEIYRIGDRALAGMAGTETFLKQLQSYDIEQVRSRHGQRVWQGRLDVANRRNEDVTTAIPVGDALTRLEPGAYIVTAAVPTRADDESGGDKSSQWFVVSDLGLTALTGEDGLHAFVRSLAGASPMAGTKVRLVARNNEVLATATTDAAGYARFAAGLARGSGGSAPALLVAETGTDYAFLDLATAAFDLTDRGVKGRDAPGSLDAFLFPERGVYRPGEPVHLTGLVRQRDGRAATLPTTLIVSRPDGVEHQRIALTDQGHGGRATTLALARSAMTGTWRVKLHADPKSDAIAQASFLVEDFVPERLDLTLTPTGKALTVGETGRIAVAGRYLYGPPAADLDLEGEIIVRAARGDVEGFPGYRFGNSEERITAVRRPLEGLGETDDAGRAEIAVELPPLPRTARPLEADVLVRLREGAGRTIERRVTMPVSLGEARIGLKPRFGDTQIGDGETAEVDVILVGTDGRASTATGLKWELVRLEQRWQWYVRDGQWGYEPVTFTRRIATGSVDAAADKPGRIAQKVDWGRYRLDVSAATAGGPRTSITFNSGWHASDNADSPEVLDVALDKGTYKVGETARLRINTREGGVAQVVVLSNGLLHARELKVPAGGTEVALEVGRDWAPGAYVAATLYRPMDEKAKRMPGRAVGLKWLSLDPAAQTLAVKLDMPDRVRPSGPLSVPIEIGGLAAGEDARVTVAAVDVGILNLTRHPSPEPQKWFLAQRKLGVELRDLYGRLIDGMRAERGSLRSGGDGPGGMSTSGSPPVEAPLSLFSGIVTVGSDGKARIELQLPDFNGSVRVMAVAWSASKVGSAAKDVIVRDKLTLTASAPRFLALGDEARIALDIHNVEGPDAAYKLAVTQAAAATTTGNLAARDVALKAGEKRRETVMLKPTELGRSSIDVRVTGPDGIEVRRRLALDVKPPAGDIRRATVASLAPGSGRIDVSKDVLADLIPSTAQVTVNVGPTATLDVAGLLGQLDRYPYGCAEQTTSRALPLLYVNDMSRRLGLASDAEIRQRIEGAVARVLEMQDASGAFGTWGPASTDIWLTAYVSDFLTRARESGYSVPTLAFNQALDRLAGFLSYTQELQGRGEAHAYALYVLARNGRAQAGDLRYYADTRLERFATPLGRAQLGAALAMIGDKERAERAFRAAMQALEAPAEQLAALDAQRSDYGSRVRDGAGLLTLVSEARVLPSAPAALADVLAKAYRGRSHTSTQEQAWMLLAARALQDARQQTRLDVNGTLQQGELLRTILPAELNRSPLAITNAGTTPVDAVVSVLGAALTPEPAIGRGFTIERTYWTLDGTQVDVASANGGTGKLEQNQRLVTVLKITGDAPGGRVMVVDRLPAGLEIENPRLVDSGDLKGLDWIKSEQAPEHSEFRDDRFVAAFNFYRNGNRGGGNATASPVTATMAYIVRAVTPGSYAHPAATVEDMYRPERFARTAAGRLEIGAAN